MGNKSASLPDLAPSEIRVMQALWSRGTLAARELHVEVGAAEGWAYTTTRTIVDRLVAKGLVTRRRLHGLIVYEAAVSRARGLARRVLDFADRVLQVDGGRLVSMLGDANALTPDDVTELERLIGRATKRRRR
jgi:BlaI family transcriptional regulator, penicillinase repressor